jgi:hypothetical protein
MLQMEPIHWMTGSMGLWVERPDYGWRVYLSILLKATHDKSERIKHLDNFFDEFRDTVHK